MGQLLFLSAAALLFGSGLAWELQLWQPLVYLSIGFKNANKTGTIVTAAIKRSRMPLSFQSVPFETYHGGK